MLQNLWNVVRAVLKVKIVIVNAYIKNEENPKLAT